MKMKNFTLYSPYEYEKPIPMPESLFPWYRQIKKVLDEQREEELKRLQEEWERSFSF